MLGRQSLIELPVDPVGVDASHRRSGHKDGKDDGQNDRRSTHQRINNVRKHSRVSVPDKSS